MNVLFQDLRFAFRAFAKNPVFTLAVLVSLAIGIGANTSIFSVVNALLLRPLPYKDADRLVILWNRSPGLNITQDWFSTAQYFDIKTHHGFEDVAIASGGNENLTGDGEPERIFSIHVSSNLLPMLGARPVLGRLFTAEEDSVGHNRTALLTYGTWQRCFGRDPHAVGRMLLLNGQSYEIVGILPRDFSLPREVLPTLYGGEQAEIFVPLPLAPEAARDRGHEDFNVIARLKHGVSVRQAQAEMDALTARLRHDYPEDYPPNGGLTFGIVPMLEQVVGDVRPALLILLGSVGFLLLIACANVANLLLSRSLGREREIAVRMALGADGNRILRQLLTESVLLSLGGGAFGVLLSILSVKWIHVLGPKSVPRLQDIGIDARVLLFTLGVSLLAAILFGLAPALRLMRLDVYGSLKVAGRDSSGARAVWGSGRNLRKLLVVSELALSVVLLIGAGLLIRSFTRVENVSPGFDPKNVLTLELTMNGRKYEKREAVIEAYRQLRERLESLPGASAAGAAFSLPLSQMFAWGPITVEGHIPPPGENFINADQRVVSGHFFQAMGIPLLRGRLFTEDDTLANPRVVIIDTYMAEQLWPGQDALGKRIRFGNLSSTGPWVTVVGIVGRIKEDALESDPRIALYLPHTQYPSRAMNIVLRSRGDPVALASAVKQEIRALDPDMPLYNVRTMQQRVDAYLAPRHFSMLLLGIFAALAMALAAIGIYSVMAYLVNQGTREIGIRMALGATPREILQFVLERGMSLAFSGVLVGLAGAFALTRLMRGLLFGVGATDPVTFVVIPLLLALVALLACYIPARRATRVDPAVSLRCE